MKNSLWGIFLGERERGDGHYTLVSQNLLGHSTMKKKLLSIKSLPERIHPTKRINGGASFCSKKKNVPFVTGLIIHQLEHKNLPKTFMARVDTISGGRLLIKSD